MITDEDAINDLKQFIATSVRNTVREELGEQSAVLRQEIVQELEEKIDSTKHELLVSMQSSKNEILTAVADTMQNHIDVTEERLDDHSKRLRKLEHKPA